MTIIKWKTVWERKGQQVCNDGRLALADLIRADGFDSGAGDHSLDSWKQLTESVYAKLQLAPGMRVHEVGCGSGAFLYPAYQAGIDVTGIDYSEALVKVAARAMPNGSFVHGEACKLLASSASFDAVLAHSVFQYFDSEEYAQRCISEMLRVLKPRGACLAILDVNDSMKKEAFHRIRAGPLGKDVYEEKYRDFPHRFYRKAWFVELLEREGCVVEICDQAVEGYTSSAFRFNVFAWPGKK